MFADGGPPKDKRGNDINFLIGFLEEEVSKLSPVDALLGQEDSTKESPTSDDAYVEPIIFDKLEPQALSQVATKP